MQPAGAGLLNQNLIATTAGGTYFLKGYRYVEPAPLAREHRVIAFAAGAGLPAVVPLSAPGGQTFLRVGGRLWAVFPRMEDRQVDAAGLSPAHAGAMGRALGRVHVALARFPPTEATRYPPRLVWDSARAGAEMREYEEAIARFPALTPFDQHALSSFAYRRTLLAAGVPPRSAFAGLPEQMLHGDFHEGNLFFGPDGEVSGIIDWELASVGPRALEIIRALDVSLRATGDAPGAAARRRAFLHGYAAEAPLTRDECLAMPELYWAYRVHSLWLYEEHYRVQVRSPHRAPSRRPGAWSRRWPAPITWRWRTSRPWSGGCSTATTSASASSPTWKPPPAGRSSPPAPEAPPWSKRTPATPSCGTPVPPS